MSAIPDSFLKFFFRQFPLNVERDIWFFDHVAKGTFKELQTPVHLRSKHIIFDDDEIIDFFRVEPAQDPFQDVVIIMVVIESTPDITLVLFVELLQSFWIIDYNMLFLLIHVQYDR